MIATTIMRLRIVNLGVKTCIDGFSPDAGLTNVTISSLPTVEATACPDAESTSLGPSVTQPFVARRPADCKVERSGL